MYSLKNDLETFSQSWTNYQHLNEDLKARLIQDTAAHIKFFISSASMCYQDGPYEMDGKGKVEALQKSPEYDAIISVMPTAAIELANASSELSFPEDQSDLALAWSELVRNVALILSPVSCECHNRRDAIAACWRTQRAAPCGLTWSVVPPDSFSNFAPLINERLHASCLTRLNAANKPVLPQEKARIALLLQSVEPLSQDRAWGRAVPEEFKALEKEFLLFMQYANHQAGGNSIAFKKACRAILQEEDRLLSSKPKPICPSPKP